MYLLGIDIGSSSIKASLIKSDTGALLASGISPKTEMKINSLNIGWAEQDPESWWKNLKIAVAEIRFETNFKPEEIVAIGISYQMHGLICVDKNQKVLRPAIIWCDSRAVAIGNKAFNELGKDYCLENYLNSPGNFTSSKLKWVMDNEPSIYEKIDKFMLPGDYIAMKLSEEIHTTISGLSEGILWDFKGGKLAASLLDYYGIDQSLVPNLAKTFSNQSYLSVNAAKELGIKAGTPISYRAGDQPNNAFSLNVLNAGEVAATAGTSGVVYGIAEKICTDAKSRVNSFVHVNHEYNDPKYGILLCLNGTGSQNSYLKNTLLQTKLSYNEINTLASNVAVGSNGVHVYPFGNGAERILNNADNGASILGLNFSTHTQSHLFRAAQEGIAYGLNFGINIMKNMGIDTKLIKAGNANMFLSPVFREAFCNVTNATLELYDTDGAQGAARGAGVGCGYYANFKEAFVGLKKIKTVEPTEYLHSEYKDLYTKWMEAMP